MTYMLYKEQKTNSREERKATKSCRRMITKSIYADVAAIITDTAIFSAQPAAIVKKLHIMLSERSNLDHFTLMQSALQLRLNDTIENYVEEHV